MTFDYFYGRESDLFSFVRIPKLLFKEERLKRLSSDSKILYGLLLDRMSLSAKNGWQDDDGRVYIIYTIDEVQDDLGCANKKAVNILAELEDIGLIEKKRQGLTKPNLIYVKNFSSEVLKEHFQKCQNDTSGNVELTGQEVSKGRTNNTDNNNTDFSDTDSIPFHSDRIRLYRESPQENGMEGNGNDALQIRKKYQDYVAENISLEILKERYPYQRELLDQLAELMVDVLCSTKDHICVGKEDKPAPIVKAQFMKINSMHIEYVLEGLQKNTTLVRNTRQYLITTLYNAPLPLDANYDTLFNHDRANGLI